MMRLRRPTEDACHTLAALNNNLFVDASWYSTSPITTGVPHRRGELPSGRHSSSDIPRTRRHAPRAVDTSLIAIEVLWSCVHVCFRELLLQYSPWTTRRFRSHLFLAPILIETRIGEWQGARPGLCPGQHPLFQPAF